MQADGQGYVDDAVDGIAADGVYVSSEVPDASALESTLAAQVGDESIAVAVFSDNAGFEASGTEILGRLADAHPGYDTIVIAVGDDLLAGSRVLPSGEALRIANEAEQSADSVEGALVETVQQVIAATPEGGSPGGADVGGVAAGVVVGAIALGAVAAAAGIAIGVRRSRRRGAARDDRRHPLPEPVRTHVHTLQGLTGAYAQAGAAGVPQAGEVSQQVASIARNTAELFERLDRKGEEGQRATAAVEYGETLRKLTGALDRDYLLDILTHPDLWDDPVERVDEVRGAVSAFAVELVENIKQVNARRGLHFQVSLDGLIGRRKELREWDREFERASGDDAHGPGGDEPAG